MSYQASSDEGSKTVLDFLKKNISKSDIPNIETELSKDFIFGKRRSKEQKRKNKKTKTRALTRTEKKHLGFYEIPRNGIKYNDVVPINRMWSDYMWGLLEMDKNNPEVQSKSWEQFTQSIYKADFHGSLLQVVRSKCPSYVGKTGICVMETRNTFKVVSETDIVTTIPKKDCVFEVYLKNVKITLFGKLLCARPAERSSKKIRSQIFPDL